MNKLRVISMNIALFIIVCIVLAMLSEASIRLFERVFPPAKAKIIPSQNQRLVYELDPDNPQVNSNKMRGAELSLDELKDKYVIAAIGDSHTYSVEAHENSATYPSRLEYHLNGLLLDDKVRVLNFGVPGYNAAQELEVLKTKVLPLQPDLIVWQYCINDTHIPNWIQPTHSRLNRLFHTSHFFTRLWKLVVYTRFHGWPLFGSVHDGVYKFIGTHFPDLMLYEPGLVGVLLDADGHHPTSDPTLVPQRYRYMLGTKNLATTIDEFGRLCRSNKIPAIATGFIEPDARLAYEKAGFYVVSNADLFMDRDMRLYGYDPNHTGDHYDEKGCDYLGQSLAEYIYNNVLSSNKSS